MNILVIEDDKRISEYLETSLKALQYNVTICHTLDEAQAVLAQDNFETDLALIDRMIGNQEGGHMVEPLRRKFPSIGIIILSSLDSPTEKARWLDLGIDDYVGKPFSFEELSARIRNVLRRKRPSHNTVQTHHLILKNLKFDLLSQQCRVGQQTLNLTKKELQLLLLMMEKPGRILSKNQILDRVWQIETNVESNVVEVTIKNLRKKLEDAHAEAQIKSRRNMGYWIEE